MRFNKKLTVVISLILTISLLFSCLPVNAATQSLTELNKQLADLQAEANRINNNINSLKGDIRNASALKKEYQKQTDNLQAQIDACETHISKFEGQIADIEKDIEKSEAEIKDTKILLKQRVRSLLMLGKGEISIILGNDGFSNYISGEALAKRILVYDEALINEINAHIDEIEIKKQEIDKQKSEMLSVKKTLSVKYAELSRKENEINRELNSLYDKSDDLKNELEMVEDAKAEFERLIANLIAGEKGEDNPIYSGAKFTWPTPGYYYITSYYGNRKDPFDKTSNEFHKGLDISGSGIGGKPIVACASGKVTFAGFNEWGYGNYVVLNHGNNSKGQLLTTHYAHMRSVAVSSGQYVVKGQVIGYVGTTGASKGNHLHLEVRLDGSHTNPLPYLQ